MGSAILVSATNYFPSQPECAAIKRRDPIPSRPANRREHRCWHESRGSPLRRRPRFRQSYVPQGGDPRHLGLDLARTSRPRFALWSSHASENLGFTTVAVLTLALGIGANTAIFQLIDALRLRPIPVKEPQQLVAVQLADSTGVRGSQASGYPVLTNAVWEKLRDPQDVFSGVLAWGSNSFGLSPGGEVRLAQGLFVSGDFFHVLGVRPLLGRVFTAADDRRGCGLPGAVVSYAFWQRELGGDPSPIGRKLTLNYHPVEIIGVTPPGFFGLEVGRS